MKVFLNVKKFGKIENARIELSDFTLFVGHNNSGKSMLMQLIYGLLEEVDSYTGVAVPDGATENDEFEFSAEWIDNVISGFNNYIQANMEKIIHKIFRRNINIESLSLDVVTENQYYFAKIENRIEERIVDNKNKNETHKVVTKIRRRCTIYKINGEKHPVWAIEFGDDIRRASLASLVSGMVFKRILNNDSSSLAKLFIPASRTGLQLLYKYYFAGKQYNYSEHPQIEISINDEILDADMDYGITKPVDDFLHFLQMYQQREELRVDRRLLMNYLEKYLLNGKIKQLADETYYEEKGSDRQIPMYIASSMINELAPVAKVLDCSTEYGLIIYDEIETCLHPLKQEYLARLLARMSKAGYRLLLSTHSDNMAECLNRIAILSDLNTKGVDIEEKLKSIGMDKKDLLYSTNIKVYQFREKDGQTEVKELEFASYPQGGYNFELFSENLDNQYNAAKTLLR